jgi:hypothetical protein
MQAQWARRRSAGGAVHGAAQCRRSAPHPTPSTHSFKLAQQDALLLELLLGRGPSLGIKKTRENRRKSSAKHLVTILFAFCAW